MNPMKENSAIPSDHPRAESLRLREKIIEHHEMEVVATAGLIAQGRGEAFDYLLGETTTESALKAIKAAAAAMILAKHPVFSVNGNVAALCAEDIVNVTSVINAKIEVNLFYGSRARMYAIEKVLKNAGADEILGIDEKYYSQIPELSSQRRRVDERGILKADVVLVPLEDGDRTEALRKMGKRVIAIDLNPLSRTAQCASITIVDNVVRALPILAKDILKLTRAPKQTLEEIISDFHNREVLGDAINHIHFRLRDLAEKGIYLYEDTEIFQHAEERGYH